MKFILGKKLAMTQLWLDEKVISVTPVSVSPCIISQIKTLKTDGYEALQVACGTRKVKNINKPQQGHFKLANINPMHVREFRTSPVPEVQVGQQISLDSFSENEIVDVTGVSKGKGFQGVVKRHGFAGGRKTHGNKDQLRMPGSIGSKGPARVFKGMKMGGRMGGERVTVKNLNIIKIDLDNNLLFIQGGVPGAINSLLTIKAPGELKFTNVVSQDNLTDKKTTPEVPTENQVSPVESKQVDTDLAVNQEADKPADKPQEVVESAEQVSDEKKSQATEEKVETNKEVADSPKTDNNQATEKSQDNTKEKTA